MNECSLKGGLFPKLRKGGNMRRWESEKLTNLGHANLWHRSYFLSKYTYLDCSHLSNVWCVNKCFEMQLHYIISNRQTNVYPSRNGPIKINVTCNSTRYSRTIDSCKHKELLGHSSHTQFICLHYLFKDSRSWLVSMLRSPSYSRWSSIWSFLLHQTTNP